MLELLDQQQKLTANQWKIALAATVGDMLDFFDFFLIGFVLAFSRTRLDSIHCGALRRQAHLQPAFLAFQRP